MSKSTFSQLILFSIALQQIGCASYFKRQSCESINWFEHGQKVAMQGQWLNADETVRDCRKADADIGESDLDRGFKSGVAKYCSASNTYKIGKNGDLFSRDICEGPEIQVLLAKHQEGIRDYCAKENGFSVGTSGKKYNQICPKDLESGFLEEYRKGRKKYVHALIESKSQEIHRLDSEASQKKHDLSYARGSLSSLENQKTTLESLKSQAKATNQNQLVAPYDSQLEALNIDVSKQRSEVSAIQQDLNSIETKKSTLQNEISAFKEELPGLDR